MKRPPFFVTQVLLFVVAAVACDASRVSTDDDTDGLGGDDDDDDNDDDDDHPHGVGTPLQVNGPLQVIGTELCNQYGHPIQLRGMSTHGLQWFEQCLTGPSLDALANDWGADVIRLSMYVQEGGFEDDPAYFTALVDELVDEAYDRGMYAIIDWHMLTPGDPNANLDLARGFFEHMSAAHGDKDHVLYDICNEPNGNSVTWDKIHNYAMEIIPIIRENDPDGVVLVGTPWWSSAPDEVIGNELPFDDVMYTMHFYAADHGAESRANVKRAVAGGIPVFVTEFGTQEATGDGGNDFTSSQAWLDLLDEHKISWVNWNFSDDHRTGAVWEEGTCPHGPWTSDQLKEAGTWVRDRMLNPPDAFPID